MSIMTVVGARPQFIKAAITSEALARAGVEEAIVHTGQHFDENMSDNFFSELNIPEPIARFEICETHHGAQTAVMLQNLEPLMLQRSPEAVLVYGDTNSTLAGALAASKLHIPVLHVEAGLRSFNNNMPEEINRIVTDRISQRLYAPTEVAKSHLLAEGTPESAICVSGDVMYDLFKRTVARVMDEPGQREKSPRPRLLVTAHRPGNVDNPDKLGVLVDALVSLQQNMDVLWPLHPRTRSQLQSTGLMARLERARIEVVAPLGYKDLVQALLRCDVVCTDSGGVQKEAFFAKRPCITVREQTEWVETVNSGWNKLVPLQDAATLSAAIRQIAGTTGEPVSPYGNGNAADIIAQDIKSLLRK